MERAGSQVRLFLHWTEEVKLSDEKPSRGSVTATMKSREEDTYLIHLLLGRRGTGGTRGTRRTILLSMGYKEGGPAGTGPVPLRAGTPCPSPRYHPDPPETLRVPPVPPVPPQSRGLP